MLHNIHRNLLILLMHGLLKQDDSYKLGFGQQPVKV